MGLVFRRRVRLTRRTHLNMSNSGASVSYKPTKRITVNSRGRITIRLGKGFSWRIP